MYLLHAKIVLFGLLSAFLNGYDDLGERLSQSEDIWTELLRSYRTSGTSENVHSANDDNNSVEEYESEIYATEMDDDFPWNDYHSTGESLSWNNLRTLNRTVRAQSATLGEEADEENIPEGVSLAFVFDSTGSMSAELTEVKRGAAKILAALRDHPDSPIYNYVWVPFNDPGIGPFTVTTDPKLFELRMSEVHVHGGGDCPEMALGAIKKALELSRPYSYIYVFTDAPAKDVNLQKEVLSQVQRKRIQVVFIITPGCLSKQETTYPIYKQIAEASSGQIYSLNTVEVSEVLKFVKKSLQPNVVSLLSVNKPAPLEWTPDKMEVSVDDSLKEFTVSVSGINAKINVTDPKGIQIQGPPQLENVVNLVNLKVVKVNEPEPGAWSVSVNSDSYYTIKSTGLSKINFKHGFSTGKTSNMKETNYRPLKGAKSYILIQTSDADQPFNITHADFIGLNGNFLQNITLVGVDGKQGLYEGDSFVPPNDFFYIRVIGKSENGTLVKRITSTAIEPQLPEKPIITMKTKAVGKIQTSAAIKCYVESVVPFNVSWYKDDKQLIENQNCSETCEVILNISTITINSEGKYTCKAENVAGEDSKVLQFVVKGEPPLVTVNSPVLGFLGQKVLLDCSVTSDLPVSVTWTQLTPINSHSGVLHPPSTGVKLENNTLLIESVKAEDEGWYVCVADNKEGKSEGRVMLEIKQPLLVKVEPSTLTFTKGDSARLLCSAVGKPEPRIEWQKNQQAIKDPSVFVEEITEKLNLVIGYLDIRHAGIYTCNAINEEESASSSVELIYQEHPKVKAKENSMIVKAGLDVVMKCAATGVPEPTISWFKEGQELEDNNKYEINNDTLIVKSSEASDFGEYSCVASNERGSAVDHIGLTIGSSPSFLQKPRTKKIQINHAGTILCSAIGFPLPEIKWKRPDGRDINSTNMFVLPSGALKITRMMYEDAGEYICTAENVFGSVSHQFSIKVTGVEKPMLDNVTMLSEVTAMSGSELTIPCGLTLGSPPAKVKWFKDNIEVIQSDEFKIESSGMLLIKNATVENRGSYQCFAENVVGNISRSYDILIFESPTITESKKEELKKGEVGGEIVIECPVKGYPPPTIVWAKNGLPLQTSSTVFQDEQGSLIIKNLTEDNGGVYKCIAFNTLGSVSKEAAVQIQIPPTFTDDAQDYSVNVVEGNIVVLNCNVSGTPDPVVQWYRDEEPLALDGEQPKILRFFATMERTGVFRCNVSNEAGNDSREFNVTILVPPKILGRHSEESLKAKAGVPVTIICNVVGVPIPTILWQRNGMYLTQNTSDTIISDDGSLTILNVTKESAGSYTCDAENLGGIAQRAYYLQVHYPPKIAEVENETRSIVLKEDEEFSLACMVEGNPKPNVIWKKNGIPISKHQNDLIVLEDNTLMFLLVNKETTGTYKCEAVNTEGSTSKEHDILVVTPPSLTNDIYPTKLEVNEGDSLVITCPTEMSVTPSNIQWTKDGEPLDHLFHERSDEAKVKISPDYRTITILEANPSDGGNYSCIATNLAGRTDVKFVVEILMCPLFEEFNHVPHRTIITGGEVILNCSVSGNPPPKVIWRKENASVTPSNTPGVYVTLDRRHLMITNGRVEHSGTYVCLAINKVSTKEREFYVTVLDPPQISGPLQEVVQVIKGSNVTLDCKATGVPTPTFTWIKDDDTKTIFNNTEDTLKIINASSEDSGSYLCDVTNTAGTRTKHFEVNLFEKPQIENQEVVDKIDSVAGGNITLVGKTSGNPKPNTTWLHNGRRVKRHAQVEENNNSVALTLDNVVKEDEGDYTLLAYNSAGIVEKKFNLRILVPPQLMQGHEHGSEFLQVVHSFPIFLKCPVEGDPIPQIFWFDGNDREKSIKESDDVTIFENELWIKAANASNSRTYVCLAENPVGQIIYTFNVSVIEMPRVNGDKNEFYDLRVNDSLKLFCNVSNSADTSFSWFHFLTPIKNDTGVIVSGNGQALVLTEVQMRHSGVYACIAANKAGSAQIQYHVNVYDPTDLDQSTYENRRTVKLNDPFTLYCLVVRYSLTDITWYKDGKIIDPKANENSIDYGDFHLKFFASKPQDAGDYKCVAKTKDSTTELNYRVDIVVPGKWSRWSNWSPCSVSCGDGVQLRRRSCVVENINLDSRLKIDKKSCKGDEMAKRPCSQACEVNNDKNNWGNWSPCSKTCGNGIRKRCRLHNNLTFREGGEDCTGSNAEVEPCIERECPADSYRCKWNGHLCKGETMRRVRKWDSSSKSGGKGCAGSESEEQDEVEKRIQLRDLGVWSSWKEWSPCSQTCGKGYRKRSRTCISLNINQKHVYCEGEPIQIEECFSNCPKNTYPFLSSLQLKGNLNGNTINKNMNVKIEELEDERQISTNLLNVVEEDKWLPYTPFLLSPLAWNAAYEIDNANNGYSLTNGNFLSQSDIKFETGEELKVKHRGDGIDSNGTFIVEIEVVGELPVVKPNAVVAIAPMEQDFVQASPKTLLSFTRSNLSVNGRDLPYSWNNSIQYDAQKGTMPYLVEKLTMKDFSTVYDSKTRSFNFTASSSIGKKFDENKCPPGFIHDRNFMHCEDLNECESELSVCEINQICKNSFGSYKCLCQKGYKMTEGQCLDVDECSQHYSTCSHFCHNTPGSYMCSCPTGFYLQENRRNCLKMSSTSEYKTYNEVQEMKKKITSAENHIADYDKYQEHKAVKNLTCPRGFTLKTSECQDSNECEIFPNICDHDETCVNLVGSFQCVSTPCPPEYERTKALKHCIKVCSLENKCERGATIAQSVTFYPALLKTKNILPLDKINKPLCNALNASYVVKEPLKQFEVRKSEGRHFLYPMKKLNRNTLYRVRVEASSYGWKGKLMYVDELIIFLVVS